MGRLSDWEQRARDKDIARMIRQCEQFRAPMAGERSRLGERLAARKARKPGRGRRSR